MSRYETIGHQRRTPLRRSRNDRVLGGICAGIAARLGLDPLLVRAATAVLALITGGGVAVAYLLAWALIPASSDESDSPRLPPTARVCCTDK